MSIRSLIACVFAMIPFYSHAARVALDGITAIVNNEAILASDVEAFREKLDKPGMVDELLLLGGKTEDLKKDKNLKLNYLISERILDSEIKRLNLAITIERVEQEIREIAKRNKMTRNELAQALTAQGVKMSDYQAFMKTRIERQALMEQEITSKIRVNDEDVLAEYLRRHPNSESGAEYTLAHIYFNPRKGGAEAAQKRAEDVLAKLKAGESFETLAEQHSEDSNFSQGGMLGVFKTGEISPDFEKAVGPLTPGEYSGIVNSRGGIHILKLVGRKVIPDPRFDQERDPIRAQLMEKSFQKHFRDWLEGKREEAFIRNNSSPSKS